MSQSHNLQFLESTNNLSSVIERKHGWHPNLEQTQEILACIRQGRLFYEASASSPIEIRPLQQFYGMLGFAKALILVTDRKNRLGNLAGSHALKDTSAPDSQLAELSAKITGRGTFHYFNDAVEDEQTLRSIATMRSSVGDVKAALVALNNSLLKRVRDGERQYWRFRHPTIRDAFAEFVGANPELIDIYLAGVTTERLMGEVICGDVDVQGAKIIIPRERYDEILKRLRQAKRTGVWYSDPVGSFLAIRCATDFLRRYFTEVEAIGCLPGEILSVARYDNSLRILRRLHNEGHLPNDVRIEAVKRVGQLSSGSYSTRFMDREIVGDLLTESESERLFAMIKDEVLSNEDDIISEVEDNWEKDADPNDNYSEIRKTLERVEDEGGDEEAARATAFLERVSESITSLESRQEAEPEYDNLETEDTGVEIHAVKRSVFDDIDE